MNADIDECTEESHRCEQSCHNAVGSYACSCDIGYHLNLDGLTCTGILKEIKVNFPNSDCHLMQTLTSVQKELKNVRSIAITQLVVMSATVPDPAIDFTVMAPLVKVSHHTYKPHKFIFMK